MQNRQTLFKGNFYILGNNFVEKVDEKANFVIIISMNKDRGAVLKSSTHFARRILVCMKGITAEVKNDFRVVFGWCDAEYVLHCHNFLWSAID